MIYASDSRINNDKEAYASLRGAIEALEKNDFNTASKNIKSVLEYNKKHRFLDKEDKLLILQALGIALIGMGEYEEGLSHIEYVYNKVIETRECEDSLSLSALHMLGEAYLIANRTKDALAIFEYEHNTRQSMMIKEQ